MALLSRGGSHRRLSFYIFWKKHAWRNNVSKLMLQFKTRQNGVWTVKISGPTTKKRCASSYQFLSTKQNRKTNGYKNRIKSEKLSLSAMLHVYLYSPPATPLFFLRNQLIHLNLNLPCARALLAVASLWTGLNLLGFHVTCSTWAVK